MPHGSLQRMHVALQAVHFLQCFSCSGCLAQWVRARVTWRDRVQSNCSAGSPMRTHLIAARSSAAAGHHMGCRNQAPQNDHTWHEAAGGPRHPPGLLLGGERKGVPAGNGCNGGRVRAGAWWWGCQRWWWAGNGVLHSRGAAWLPPRCTGWPMLELGCHQVHHLGLLCCGRGLDG
jgi:hypothetical protein